MLPAHAAIPADEAALKVARIDQRLERRPVGPRRRGVAARRRGVAQGLVRSLVVVALPEAIKAVLLGRQVRLGWARGRGLERFVHAFVPPVLLGVRGLDQLG